MSSEAVSYYIQRFQLALETVGRGQVLVSRTHQMKHPDLVLALNLDREAIVAELQRRVQPMAVEAGSGDGHLDPMRHAAPAIARLERALTWIRGLERMGKVPRVVHTKEGGTRITDQDGAELDHPIGCLPEVLWHIRREYPADTAGLRWAHNRTDGGEVA